uniref:Proteasome subunit alpha type n=1 Tax=Mesocestoides corti TaxID=53468 RepID=A0A5K3FM75_MESCO
FFKAYVTSTQLYNWRFTTDELANQRQECNAAARKRLAPVTKANADASQGGVSNAEAEPLLLTAEDELIIVKRYILIMKELFHKFEEPKLPPDVFGFAATYFKRFYLNNSVMDYFPREMMLTALYLACKAADFPLGLQTFTSHIPRNRERYSDFIVNSELFLMEKLQYDLWIHTPYRPLCGLIVDLVAYQNALRERRGQKPVEDAASLVATLKAEGYEIIHTWFQTDLCLTHPPSQFALAVLLELGRTRPELEVEAFVRDEVCGCAPLKSDEPCGDSSRGEENQPSVQSGEPTPQQQWSNLSEKMEHIQAMIAEFEFLEDLSQTGEEEAVLLQCRNPLYDPLSEEYAAAKERANKLMSFIE